MIVPRAAPRCRGDDVDGKLSMALRRPLLKSVVVQGNRVKNEMTRA
jgi:hypothetical protein